MQLRNCGKYLHTSVDRTLWVVSLSPTPTANARYSGLERIYVNDRTSSILTSIPWILALKWMVAERPLLQILQIMIKSIWYICLWINWQWVGYHWVNSDHTTSFQVISNTILHFCLSSCDRVSFVKWRTKPNPYVKLSRAPDRVLRCSPVSSACAINSWWQCWVPDTHAANECKCAIFQTLLNQLYLQTIVMYRVDVTYWSLSQPHTCCGVFVTHWDESIYQSPNLPVWRTAGPTPMHRHTAIGYITASQIKSELRRKLIFWIWGC